MLGNRFAVFTVGLGIGAAGLLLLAPRSGKETRRWIGKTGARAKKSTNQLLHRGKAGFAQVRHVLTHVAA